MGRRKDYEPKHFRTCKRCQSTFKTTSKRAKFCEGCKKSKGRKNKPILKENQ